ncbi:MAG: hypothetical protein IKB11_02190 [Bacteroidaceae bacterium]|nr:hypothetical protein [Bacteroidaceae bacterium]
MDRNGHQWVDLGLSVLWSSEPLTGYYFWKDSNKKTDTRYNCPSPIYDEKDAATEQWGHKWRTPTKEEFEELITKCKWEKILNRGVNPEYLSPDEFKIKIIGPNGNQIYLSAMGKQQQGFGIGLPYDERFRIDYSFFGFWTSSKEETTNNHTEKNDERGYAFKYYGFHDFPPTLTAKQKKERELAWDRFRLLGLSPQEYVIQSNSMKLEHTKIIDAMGDDWQERMENNKNDNDKRRNLWLETPLLPTHSQKIIEYERRVQLFCRKIQLSDRNDLYKIHPVAEKKWQGKI